jgi:antitoxin (DNA-binding transcriptional repressor) of toxin-antitoxin stability system
MTRQKLTATEETAKEEIEHVCHGFDNCCAGNPLAPAATARRDNPLTLPLMNAEPQSPPAARAPTNVDKKSSAGTTPDPWLVCTKLEYGGDRSLAWSVREQVIATPPEGRARVEDRLLKSLALPGCTEAGRAFLCSMLAMVGSAKSVPILAPLLRDPKTTEAARYALQPIPGAEVDAALREALPAVIDRAKAGLIGTIAMRGDVAARPALTAIQQNAAEPALVREAAARAVERLSNLNA